MQVSYFRSAENLRSTVKLNVCEVAEQDCGSSARCGFQVKR